MIERHTFLVASRLARSQALLEAACAQAHGRQILSPAQAVARLAGGFLPVPDPATHRFATLNRAFLSQGLVIEIETARRLPRPVMLVHHSVADSESIASHPRLMIRAGRQSEATIIEQYTGNDGHANLCNALTEIDLAPSASLTHYRIQNEGDGAFHIGSVFARLAAGASLYSHNLMLGARLSRVDIQAELLGTGAELTMDGLYLGKGRQHLDNNTLVHHREPGATSSQDYRGIVADQARAVFCGKAVVHQDAQKTVARQSNRNLLLSEGAEIDAKPVLEIYADDVQCSHGATVGQIDESALFYLRSRGLSLSEARKLLTFAFAEDLILRIGDKAIRGAMEQHLADWLPDLPAVEELVGKS